MPMMARRDELPVALLPPGEWVEDAACRDLGDDLGVNFFPDLDEEEDPGPALAVCARCPVATQCLDFALSTGQEWGIWGGTTEYERGRVRTRRRRAAESSSNRRVPSSVTVRPTCPSCLSQDVVVPYDPSHLTCVVCRIVWPAPIR